MGRAMLEGWHKNHILGQCDIIDPSISAEDLSYIDHDFTFHQSPASLSNKIEVLVFAVKPQILRDILPDYQHRILPQTVVVSIVAGVNLSTYESAFSQKTPILRCMPNTPVSAGQGVTGIYANQAISTENKDTIEALMSALGTVLWLEKEDQMHALTAISGSGPAYIFYMIEVLKEIALDFGFTDKDADILARNTVLGSAVLAQHNGDIGAAILRKNVTSPGGTTEAGLKALMDSDSGLYQLMLKTIQNAHNRSIELSQD